MGGGVALFDADGDGDLDCYLVNQNRLLPDTARSGEHTNRLFLQQPDGSFVDATERSGLGDGGFGMGVAIGDVDNDGNADVYVTNYGPDALYRNRGDGTFEDATAAARIEVGGWSTSATFLDYDRDGWLDLYVARYLVWDPDKRCSTASGRRDYCGPAAFLPERDVLLHNEGGGTFTDVSAESGIRAAAGAGLGVLGDDLDGDGRIDLYVANDGYANNLWINRGDGTFRDEAVELGAAYNVRGVAEAGMGLVAADLDDDGRTDLFLTHLHRETNTLYRNLGEGRGFVDQTDASGLGLDSWLLTGFGAAAFDAELDGDLDLVVANGRVKMREPFAGARLPAPWDQLAEPNRLYLNQGGGRFRPAPAEGGPLTARVEVSRGLASGDVDGDGDVDLLLGNLQGPARLYLNRAPRSGSLLALRAVDPRLGRDALGARVRAITGGGVRQRSVTSGTSYLSSSPPVAYFTVVQGAPIERLEVLWPDGYEEAFPGPPAAGGGVLVRGAGEPRR